MRRLASTLAGRRPASIASILVQHNDDPVRRSRRWTWFYRRCGCQKPAPPGTPAESCSAGVPSLLLPTPKANAWQFSMGVRAWRFYSAETF
jgi:hypothetical protein